MWRWVGQEGHTGTFGGDGNFLYFDYGCGHTTLFVRTYRPVHFWAVTSQRKIPGWPINMWKGAGHLTHQGIQMKTTMRYHLLEWLKWERLPTLNIGEIVEYYVHSVVQPLWRPVWHFLWNWTSTVWSSNSNTLEENTHSWKDLCRNVHIKPQTGNSPNTYHLKNG